MPGPYEVHHLLGNQPIPASRVRRSLRVVHDAHGKRMGAIRRAPGRGEQDAPRAGRIETISCRVGETVREGQILIQFASQEAE